MVSVKNIEKKITLALEDIKAFDVISIDVRKRTSLADFMIIASASSSRQTKALARNVAEKMSNWIENFSSITFIIGGADGLDSSLVNKSSSTLSLSRMTLPHHLVKIFLAEQLYRSFSILNNHPYHRE